MNAAGIAELKRRLKATRDPAERLPLLLDLAQAHYHPDKPAARRYAAQALNTARRLTDIKAAARAANLLADILRVEGRMESARRYCGLGRQYARQSGDRPAETDSINNLGLIHWHQGKFDRAIADFQAALALSAETGSAKSESRALVNLSLLYWEKGELSLAMQFQQRCLAVKERIGDGYGIGLAHLNLGLIYGDLGDWEKATECYYRALVELEAHGDQSDQALCYSNLGEIYLRRHRLDKACELFQTAIRIAEQVPAPWIKAEALGNLGECRFRQGDFARARACYEEDLKLCRRMDDREELAETWRRLGELLLAGAEPEAACEALNRALRLAKRAGARKETANIHRVIGNYFAGQNVGTAARDAYDAAQELLRDLDRSYELGRLYADYGRLYAREDDPDPAVQYLNRARAIFQRLDARFELEAVEADLARLTSTRDQVLGLVDQLSRLAAHAQHPEEFCRAALAALNAAFEFEAGALLIPAAGTFVCGPVEPAELARARRAHEPQFSPGTVCLPVGSGVGALYLRWPESRPPLRDRTLLAVIGSILALGIERTTPGAGLAAALTRPAVQNPRPGLVGAETSLREVMEIVRQVAPTRASVLILGETGTGKELIARTIHELSPRARQPFVGINCAAIPETLRESELFGIERGTATGVSERPGRFEQAAGGTVLLDEIGDMSLALQARILRLLQERQFERVGGRELREVDVRIIAATNRDLAAAIRAGTFRSDLYYRLNVVSITLPPLRARKPDIPLFAGHFLKRYAREYGKRLAGFDPAALDRLAACDWPGNVRELENVVERAVVLARGGVVTTADLPPALQAAGEQSADYRQARTQARTEAGAIEKDFLLQTLARLEWNITRAAEELGITRRHVYRLMKRHGIEKEPSSKSKARNSNQVQSPN